MSDDRNMESHNRPVRADARRNIDALLRAARAVFDASGVDAPVKEIADRAGVGVGTLYRHFPQRPDLIKAIRHQLGLETPDSLRALGVRLLPAGHDEALALAIADDAHLDEL